MKKIILAGILMGIIAIGLIVVPANYDQFVEGKHFKRVIQTITLDSKPHRATGHESHQAIEVLSPMENVLYKGTLSYAASKSVDVLVYHKLTGEGKGQTVHEMDGVRYAVETAVSGKSGNAKFAGDAVLFHTSTSEPYSVTVSMAAQARAMKGEIPTMIVEKVSEEREVRVKQEPDKIVYWILPGPTKLNEQVFGTPELPLNTGELKIKQAKGAVKELLMKEPILVGVPLAMRKTNEDNTKFTETTKPTPVSNNGKIVSGYFDITYKDRQPYDLLGDPTNTLDDVDVSVTFTDPQGNRYELEVTKLYQPPFPGFESGGGVVTDAWIHGETGTDSPLFPKIFAYGAFWGIGNIIVNGEVADRDKWVHFMTTQVVRDKEYRFTTSEDLPLMPKDTFAGQLHHTHVIVRPVKITPDGPEFEPVNTAFTLPNGMKQPFIHVMFEQEEIISDDFKQWPPTIEAQPSKVAEENANVITVEGKEFALSPNKITVRKGQEVTILFKNVGGAAHNFGIGEFGVRTETIIPGETAKITFTPTEAGTFHYWCAVVGHRDAGMEGTLIVTE